VHTIRLLFQLLLCLLGLGSAAVPAKTLVFCSEGNPEFLSPSLNTNTTSFDVTGQIFESLVSFKPGTTELMPALATHWTVSADGLVYTFFLRRGVRWQYNDWFSPTREFNADDVLFSFERQWKPQHPFYRVTRALHPYFNDMGMAEMLQSIQKVDEHTVQFTLKQPVAPFVANLAMYWAGIQSAEYAQAMYKMGMPQRIDQAPLGTGPFRWVDYEKDVAVKFKAFDDYWGGRAKVDDLVFVIHPSANVRWAKLQSGACHVMAYPSPADLQQMRDDPRMKVLNQTGLNISYLAYNLSKKPFDDVRVRQALNMAINKRKILRTVYQQTAVPAINPIPPIQWGYNRELDDDEFDPDGARQLLMQAGYPQGFTTELWAMSVQRPYLPDALKVAELIQADLAAVGVKVVIQSPDWTGYGQGLHAGAHQMALYGWTGDNGDPDNFLNTLLGCDATHGHNVAKFCDLSYDRLVKRAKASSDRQERTRLYEQAQAILKVQAPWLNIAHSVQFKVMRREVTGFQLSPLGRNTFYGVDIAPPN